ncbi:MAG TPA: hypothetical protein VID47_15000 [Actinomycetota bacterium]
MGVATDRSNEVPGPAAAVGMPVPEWVTPLEAALISGTTEKAVVRAIEERRLRAWASKDGRRVLIRTSELPMAFARDPTHVRTQPPPFPGRGTPPNGAVNGRSRPPTWIEVDPGSLREWPAPAQPDRRPAPVPPGAGRTSAPGPPAPPPGTVAPRAAVHTVRRTPKPEPPAREVRRDPATEPPVPDIGSYPPPKAAPEGPAETAPVADEPPTPRIFESEPDADEAPKPERRHGRRRARAAAVVAGALVIVAALVAKSLFLTHDDRRVGPVAPTGPPTQTAPPATPTAPPTIVPAAKPRALYINAPQFTQHGARLTVATRVTNPNGAYALGPTEVTFEARDRGKHAMAISTAQIAAAPSASTLAVVTDMPLGSTAKVATVVVKARTPAWQPAATYTPPTIRVDGAGFASTGDGDLTVIAQLSNTVPARSRGQVVCVVNGPSGALTGTVTARVSLWPGQSRSFSLHVSRPAPGSHRVACEMMPEGR